MSAAEVSEPLFGMLAPQYIKRFAPQARSLVDKGAKYRHRDWVALEPEFLAGRMQLWLGVLDGKARFMCVTEIQDRPLGRAAVILYIAGEKLKQWISHLADVEKWARDEGCVQIDTWCRDGLERVLTDYRRKAVLMVKDLGDGRT